MGHSTYLAANSSSGGSPMFLILMVLIVGAFYFLLIRPQKARQKQQQAMQKSLEPGARVMTTSGMFATVVEVTDDGVVLEIAPGVEAEFVSQAIMKVVPEEPAEDPVEDEEAVEGAGEAVKDEAPTTVEAKTDDIPAAAKDTAAKDTESKDTKDAVHDETKEPAQKAADKASEKPSA